MWQLVFGLALGAGVAGRPPPEPAWLRELAARVDLYGRFDGHLAFSEAGVDVANNGSRFGLSAAQRIFPELSLFARGEWRVSLGQGDVSYAVSENPDTGLASVESSEQPAIGTRLGFVGLRFGRFGALSLGKQWGVYYDVSEWTDRYTVFGAHGSSTFNAGTDGGQTGEGRANDALVYRVDAGPISLGLQAQFLDSRAHAADSLSASFVGRFGAGLSAGVAYSHAFLDFTRDIAGYDGGDAQALTAGAKFERYGWTVSSVNTWTRNHELVVTESTTVAYDTLGAELFVARRFENRLMPYAGFDLAIPRHLDARFVNPNYGTRDVIAGLRWLLDPIADSYVYLEGRSGGSRAANGERSADLVTLGIRVNYSLRRSLGLEPAK
jgi:predicted porin